MIEQELREAFARHEPETPAAGPVHDKIQAAFVRAKRRRTLRRTASTAAAVLLIAMSAPVVLNHFQRSAAPVTAPAASAPPAAARPLDVLLLGKDDAGEPDTVMLVHLPADRSSIYLVSVPRDTKALASGSVSALTGVTFDATVTFGYDALRAVSGAAGPVEVCLPEPANTNRFRTGRQFEAGCQEIGEDDVASLLRARYGLKEGLYDRDRNTQRLFRALAAKLSTGDPARLPSLLATARDDLDVDGDTEALLAVRGADVVGITVPGTALVSRTDYEGEQLDPAVAPGLFAAIRADTLARWTAEHPAYLLD
jgi:anionic cell wall polymer biosynthesis LytR-Cps2A-Psr (LCP) family protein